MLGCAKGSLWWDEAAGQCVEESACTGQRGGGGVSLPPGLALGRPFLNAMKDEEEYPTAEFAVEWLIAQPAEVVSDWMVEL